jgi:hypothetical protein
LGSPTVNVLQPGCSLVLPPPAIRPGPWHQTLSRTYGGRNTPAQIAEDAADPVGAAFQDSAQMMETVAPEFRRAAEKAAEKVVERAGG